MSARKAAASRARVALLRGINLGGRRLPMKELVALFTEAGAESATSYIASGNVLFLAPDEEAAARIVAAVEEGIAARYGYEAPMTLRTTEEMARVVADNPFEGAEPKSLGVMFLAETPTAARVRALDPRERSPGDELVVRGREVYLRLTRGFADTKITPAWVDKTLATMSTTRNWRTVVTLAEKLAALG